MRHDDRGHSPAQPHIEVPNYCSSGVSDAKIPDAQAGWEKAYTTCLAVISGNNYIHHAAGMLESMLCIAYEQYILDDEIIGQGCKILEGINTDDDHLAYEAIWTSVPAGTTWHPATPCGTCAASISWAMVSVTRAAVTTGRTPAPFRQGNALFPWPGIFCINPWPESTLRLKSGSGRISNSYLSI